MPTTAKKLFAGVATTSGVTAYNQVPSGGNTIITNIVVANKTSSVSTVTVQFGTGGFNSATAFNFCNGLQVPANGTVNFDIRQVMNPNDVVYVGASSNNALDVLISGVEVTA
jgi:hypothetical protein